MTLHIRVATASDGPRLQEIERQAGEQFRSVGLPHIADADPFDLDELAEYSDDDRSWVAEDGSVVVGYLVIDRTGDAAHIEQVSVVPEAQGRGVGRGLMDHARRWAEANGFRSLTLMTFRDVAWNEPLYAHLGFRTLTEDEMTDELRAIRARETAEGLDPSLRVCMRIELGDATEPGA